MGLGDPLSYLLGLIVLAGSVLLCCELAHSSFLWWMLLALTVCWTTSFSHPFWLVTAKNFLGLWFLPSAGAVQHSGLDDVGHKHHGWCHWLLWIGYIVVVLKVCFSWCNGVALSVSALRRARCWHGLCWFSQGLWAASLCAIVTLWESILRVRYTWFLKNVETCLCLRKTGFGLDWDWSLTTLC